MSEFEELKDIVMDNDLDNSSKTKKRLVLVAFLIIIFLIVLVVMKLVKDSTDNEMISNMQIPKIESLQENVDTQIFEQIPIEDDSSESEDDLLLDNYLNINDTSKKEEQSLEDLISDIKNQPAEEEQKINRYSSEKVLKNIEPKIVPKIAVPRKNTIEKRVYKEPKVFTKRLTQDAKDLIVGSYVQVGAIHRNKPNTKFLNSLKSKGYTYRLYDIKIKSKVYTKVLIGPYRNRSDLKIALQEIKSSVNKSAFIYIIKE